MTQFDLPHDFNKNTQSVLFVTSQLRTRELKMAYALKSLGWTVGLIYQDITPFTPSQNFDYFHEVHSAKEAHKLAKSLSPRIIHVFSGAIDDYILLFCRHKIAPVIIDLNDVFAPALFKYHHERFRLTKKALALADGFCARDLQVKYTELIDGFKIPPQILLFPEYCLNNQTVQTQQKKELDDIHVVLVGTFSLEILGAYDGCYLTLAQKLIAHKIHFHIYPHWQYRNGAKDPNIFFQRDFAQFLELERKTSYLHIHQSLPTEALSKELLKYDFGIVSGGFEGFGQKLTYYKLAYLQSCYSGRISDYLDAHLPVLVNNEVKYNYWLTHRYKVGLDLKDIAKPEFKATLLAYKCSATLAKNMDRAVKKLSILENAPRLAAFYTKLMNTPQCRKILFFHKLMGYLKKSDDI